MFFEASASTLNFDKLSFKQYTTIIIGAVETRKLWHMDIPRSIANTRMATITQSMEPRHAKLNFTWHLKVHNAMSQLPYRVETREPLLRSSPKHTMGLCS